MVKTGGSIGERASAGCVTLIARLFFVALFGGMLFVFLSTFGVWWGIVPPEFATLDFLSFQPSTYKQARSLTKQGKYQEAIRQYNLFFIRDAPKASKNTILEAHMALANIYNELYSNPQSTGDPQQREQWRKQAMAQCDEVLKINRGYNEAVTLKQVLAVQGR